MTARKTKATTSATPKIRVQVTAKAKSKAKPKTPVIAKKVKTSKLAVTSVLQSVEPMPPDSNEVNVITEAHISEAEPEVEVPEAQRRQIAVTSIEEPEAPMRPNSPLPPQTGLSVQINIPAFHRPQFKRSKAVWSTVQPHLTKRRIITVSSLAAVLILMWGTVHIMKVRHDRQVADTAVGTGQYLASKPSFIPIVPSNHPNLAAPGSTQSRFDASRGTFSFNDSLGAKQFTVSEQQLQSASAAQTAVGRAAKSLNATIQLKTNWGTAYMLTSQKYSSQSLVFGAKNLLVFLQSSSAFSNDEWIHYINSLQ